MTQRIYTVTPKAVEGQPAPTPRLVRANGRAQALRHVANEYVVALAEQEALVKLLTAGVQVEDARDVGGKDDEA